MHECTIVIPFYNGNSYLADALASASYNYDQVKEIIIVVDYGSEAPVVDAINVKIRIINNPSSTRRGAGYARALGYNAAKTKFVAFLDCDDIWGADKLKQQLSIATERNLAFCFHNFYHFNDVSYSEQIICNGPFTLEGFFRKQFTIGCLTVLLDKEALGNLEGNALKRRNDYYLWYQVIKKCDLNNLVWGGIEVSGSAGHRLHGNSLSASKLQSAASQFYFYRACGLSVVGSLRYFMWYIYYTVKARSQKYYKHT